MCITIYKNPQTKTKKQTWKKCSPLWNRVAILNILRLHRNKPEMATPICEKRAEWNNYQRWKKIFLSITLLVFWRRNKARQLLSKCQIFFFFFKAYAKYVSPGFTWQENTWVLSSFPIRQSDNTFTQVLGRAMHFNPILLQLLEVLRK